MAPRSAHTALEARQPSLDLGQVNEVARAHHLRCTIEKEISIWLSQEAWTGRWTRWRLGHASCSRPPRLGRGARSRCRPPRTLPGGGVRLGGHHLADQPTERGDAGGGLAAANQPGLVHSSACWTASGAPPSTPSGWTGSRAGARPARCVARRHPPGPPCAGPGAEPVPHSGRRRATDHHDVVFLHAPQPHATSTTTFPLAWPCSR
jgi:hypothetical protein